MSKLVKHNNKYIVSDIQLLYGDELLLANGESIDVEVRVIDNRQITSQQRKFIFALCTEYEHYTGDDKDLFRLTMQTYHAILHSLDKDNLPSLSTCSMTYANQLIDTIISFFIENDVPMRKDILQENQYKFNEKQIYVLTLKRECSVCGRRADIHHLDTVGMGNDRKKINHLGLRVLPLCREHHIEAHAIGNDRFINLYHLTPITVDEKLNHLIKKGTLRTYIEKE